MLIVSLLHSSQIESGRKEEEEEEKTHTTLTTK
jgi:hypothetical protein